MTDRRQKKKRKGRRYCQLVRCLRLLRVVRGRTRLHIGILAREFGVSTRTIRRDLAALYEAGEDVPAGFEWDIAA
jgi:predicted DNA-binding transcriptional regulator YafY